METIRAYSDQRNYQTRVTPETGIEWIRIGKLDPITTTPTGDLMISYWNKFQRISFADLETSNLENKILVWGLTAEGLNNPSSTPVGAMYPHEVQANLIQTFLSGVQIQQSYYFEFLEVVLLLISLLGILVMVYKLPTIFGGCESSLCRISGGYGFLFVVFQFRSF